MAALTFMTHINTLLTAIALTTSVAISFPATAKAEIFNLGVTDNSSTILVDSKDFFKKEYPNTFIYYTQNASEDYTLHVGGFECSLPINQFTEYVSLSSSTTLLVANSVAARRLLKLFCNVRSIKEAGF